MSFSNQRSCIITDSDSNLYNFSWEEEKVVLMYFDKGTQEVEKKVLVENATEEFDVTIDRNNIIYLICQKKDGSIIIDTHTNGTWNSSILSEPSRERVYNMTILYDNNDIHIFYSIYSNTEQTLYTIYHHAYKEEEWVTHELGQIHKREILNPFQVLVYGKKLILLYYDLINMQEEIFFREYHIDNNRWMDSIRLTTSPYSKLYLDGLIDEEDKLHIVYSQYWDGNLIIRYESYSLEDTKIQGVTESILSNPANCSYPTLVIYEKKLWTVWTEYDHVMSSFSTDMGKNWSQPYLWRESKQNVFLRHEFSSNDKDFGNTYKLKSSFGNAYPELSFIGFGTLGKAVEVPLKIPRNQKNHRQKSPRINRVKDRNELGTIRNSESKEENDITNFKKELIKIAIRVAKIEEKIQEIEHIKMELNHEEETEEETKVIKKIEERLEEVENIIYRRRRSPLSRPRE